MEDIKTKIINLLIEDSNNGEIVRLLKNQDVNIEAFQTSKEVFLDTHEARLHLNNKMQKVVHGLKETIEKARKVEIPAIVTNLIDKKNTEIFIYTDPNYKVLIGIILFPPY